MSLYVIQKTAAVFGSERNTLGHDIRVLGMSVLSGTALDWPGQALLSLLFSPFGTSSWVAGTPPSTSKKKPPTSFFYHHRR